MPNTFVMYGIRNLRITLNTTTMIHFTFPRIRQVLACVVMVGFFGCTDEESPTIESGELDPAVVSSILEAQSEFDDAFWVSNQAVSANGPRNTSDLCANISLDSDSRNLVLDFGEGCTGPDGINRSGRMLISFLSFNFEDGISYGLSFENFVVDGSTLNGSLAVSGFRRNDNDQLFFEVAITDGRVDLADGRSITHSSIRTFIWTQGEGDEEGDNIFEYSGSAMGTTLDGITYNIAFSSPLVLLSECFDEGFAFASSGVLKINLSSLEDEVTVDFGDGSCDAIAEWFYLDQSGTLNLRN